MKNLLLLLLVSISPIILFSQSLEVEGQAKISVMNPDPTAQYVVVWQADGTLAVRDVSSLSDADSDPANEIQDLSLIDDILTITNNGTATSIDLSGYLDNTDTQLTETEVDGFVGNNGYLITEVDGSVTNELELPQSPNSGDMTYWNGTAWLSVPTGADSQTLTLCNGIPTWTTNGVCPIPNVTSPTGMIWMDRNLGATQVATSSNDAASYGDLYQWGRGADGHQIRTSGTTTVLSTTDQPGHGDFILVTSSPFDWRSGQNNNFWQGVNGVNNPCPSGYRLPTDAEWDQERLSWSSNNAIGAFASPLKLPLTGSRNGSNDSIEQEGAAGLYWSSTGISFGARMLVIVSINSTVSGFAHRVTGMAVRCLME